MVLMEIKSAEPTASEAVSVGGVFIGICLSGPPGFLTYIRSEQEERPSGCEDMTAPSTAAQSVFG